jgi:hypothetical protein
LVQIFLEAKNKLKDSNPENGKCNKYSDPGESKESFYLLNFGEHGGTNPNSVTHYAYILKPCFLTLHNTIFTDTSDSLLTLAVKVDG